MSNHSERPATRRRIGTNHDWCITVHGRDEMLLLKELAESWLCDEFVNIAVIGDEITGDGGEHAQAFFKFPQGRGIAFGLLKKSLRDAGCVSAHIEPRASRSIARAGNYCLKEHFAHIAELFPEKGTVDELYREGSTPLLVAGWNCERAKPDLPSQGRRSDIEGFKEDVLAGLCKEWDTAMMNHSGLCARAEGFVRQFISRYSPLDPMSVEEWDRLKSDGTVSQWVGWAIHHLNRHMDDDIAYGSRKVGVLTDCVLNGGTGGNTGKSYFCDWYPRLMATIGIKVQVLAPGKLADMAVQLQSDIHQLLIDIPASRSDNLQWSFVEELKNGRVCSPKYHSTTIVMRNKPISVLILCNNHPDKSRRPTGDTFTMGGSRRYEGNPFPGYRIEPEQEFTLSNDRWVEYSITSSEDSDAIPDYRLPFWLPFPNEYNGVGTESDQEPSQTAGENPPN